MDQIILKRSVFFTSGDKSKRNYRVCAVTDVRLTEGTEIANKPRLRTLIIKAKSVEFAVVLRVLRTK